MTWEPHAALMSMSRAKRTSFSCATRNIARAASSVRGVQSSPASLSTRAVPSRTSNPVPPWMSGVAARGAECEVLGAKGVGVHIWKMQQTSCMRVGSTVGGPVYSTGSTRQARTYQEFEGVLPSKPRPRCDLRVAREVGEPDHATIVPRSRTCVMPRPAIGGVSPRSNDRRALRRAPTCYRNDPEHRESHRKAAFACSRVNGRHEPISFVGAEMSGINEVLGEAGHRKAAVRSR